MDALAIEIHHTMRSLDKATAIRLERLVRGALDLVNTTGANPPKPLARQAWLQRLDDLRASVGTGRQGSSTEEILDDLRSDRC